MAELTKAQAADFLDKLADLLLSCPEARLFYTIWDDGVHLEFDAKALRHVDVNLGFGYGQAGAARDTATWLRSQAAIVPPKS